MPASAILLDCRKLEKDITPVTKLMIDCPRCDPDSPQPVPRTSCDACQGTGQTPIALATIMQEIRESQLELLQGGKQGKRAIDEDEVGGEPIYGDWCDPDDLC